MRTMLGLIKTASLQFVQIARKRVSYLVENIPHIGHTLSHSTPIELESIAVEGNVSKAAVWRECQSQSIVK